MGLKALKTIKYFIISGTENKVAFSSGGFFGGFFRWVDPKKTRRVFLGMYPGLWNTVYEPSS